jgi:hypothetical protein
MPNMLRAALASSRTCPKRAKTPSSVLAAALVFGCVSIGTRPVKTQEHLVRESTEEVLVDGPGKPTAVVEGTTLKLRAVALCQQRAVRHVDRIETKERFMDDGAYPWYMGGLGLSAATVGSIGLIDATKVYGDDSNSRTYNPQGQDKAFLANGALLVTGIAAGTLLLIDTVRASGTVETSSAVEIPAEPLGDEFPCSRKLLRNEPVSAVVGDEQKSLGTTGATGKLEVDLDAVLPSSFVSNELPIAIRGQTVLTVDVSPFQRMREEKVWKDLGLDECRRPTASNSCDRVMQFLERFPTGIHGGEATALLEEVRPALERLQDVEEWALIDKSCKAVEFTSSEEGTRACQPIRAYLERRPEGVYAAEATKILAAADRKIAQFATAEQNAARRAAAEAEAREHAEVAAGVNACRAGCRNQCRLAMYQDEPMCADGCYAAFCEQGNGCVGTCKMECSMFKYDDHQGCLRDCRVARRCGR